MKLDLSEIAHNIGKRQKYAIDQPCWEKEESDVGCVGKIVGEVDFSNTGRLIIARGWLTACLEMECSRCLTSFRTPVETKIEEQFEIPNYQATLNGVEDEEEDAPVEPDPLFEDNILDLSAFVREILMLSVPIRPLCSAVCKGLCEQCGQNLNLSGCDCPAATESPLAGLAELLRQREDGETQ